MLKFDQVTGWQISRYTTPQRLLLGGALNVLTVLVYSLHAAAIV